MNAPQAIESAYVRLAAINVNTHTEKKNNLTYLSWAWAVDQLMRADPAATWTYQEPVKWGDTVMVFCTVTAFGKAMTAQLPVMNHKNQAIPNPDAFAVNTAMQRCLAKAIALHGLGLYIYAGEDLPVEEKEGQAEAEAALKARAEAAADEKLLEQYREAAAQGMAALKAFHTMAKGDGKTRVWKSHGEELKATAEGVPA